MNIGMHIFGALVTPIFGTIVLVLYISTSVWVLCAPDAGRNSHFQRFFMQKSLKSKHFETKILKLLVIYNFSQVKTCFLRKKQIFWGIKQSTSVLVQIKKKCFSKILLQISCFFQLFAEKNAENDYFDQRLECAAPKRWSKYTTFLRSNLKPIFHTINTSFYMPCYRHCTLLRHSI